MRKLPGFFIFSGLLLLSSCFSSRNAITPQRTPVIDPIQIELDTSKNITFADTVPVDTLQSLASDIAHVQVIDDQESNNEAIIPKIDTLCIIGTGDIMPGTNYPDERFLPPGNNCQKLFAPVAEILGSGDVTFGNLEGVFCPEGGEAKKCKDPSVCYVFRMPDDYLNCILDAGYDVLSVANNHVNDFGVEGRISTAKLLKEAGVPFAGFQSFPSTTFQKDGVSYGFAAFSPHTGTMSLKDYEGAAAIVAGLDSLCDVVIISLHGGAEGKDHQHVPCTDEEYLGYNRGNVCKFAHSVIDAGADIVFGHGPHVIRAMELYKERLICYSLGNFCTYARFNLSGPNGLAPIVKVYTDHEGRFLEGKIISAMQLGEGGPRPDPSNNAVQKFRELTETDFPETNLLIQNDGRFSRKN
ncbi:CapA family protein [Bacteroidota bacterium]